MEALASGCLTTAFVWAQHHNAVGVVANAAPAPLRERFLAELCSGRVRSGVAFAGLRRPGPPILTAALEGDALVLEGEVPWLTGWGRIDVVHVAARRGDGDVVWALVDAATSASFSVRPLELAALNASATVAAAFTRHVVPADRVTLVEPFATWSARDEAALWRNGFMALGVAGRCAALLGDDGLRAEIAACRAVLATEPVAAAPAARAHAAAIALRAAAALVAAGGGRSMLRGAQAQRLAREALFLLVFGQTASIRQAQLERFAEATAAGRG